MRGKPGKIFGLILALILGVFFCAPVQVWAGTQAIDVQLSGSGNDAEEDNFGIVTLTEDTLDLGGLNKIVGLRFTGVSVPKNAAITNAYIEFTTDGQDSGTTSVTVEGIASDNATAFTDSFFDLSSKPVFSTSVDWDINFDWLTVEAVHQSPDISAIIQNLVDRDGWVSGNAMAFKIIGSEEIYRRATAVDQSADHAPKLHIEFTANVIEVQVSQSTDDMYSSYFGMTETLFNGDDIRLVYSSYYQSGYRFQNVDIPEGAVINYAHIEFTASQDNTAGTHYMRFRGDKRLSPPTFSLVGRDPEAIYNRSLYYRTDTYRTWSGIPSWTANEKYQSVDLKDIVQELVGQSGWDTSDKSMAFIIYYGNEQRYAWSYDGDPAKAPKLYIEYGSALGDEGGGDTPVPVMTIGETTLGRSCWEGDTADSQHFNLINSGSATLNYTVNVTYNLGSGWLSLNPAGTPLSLEPGTTQPFTVVFNSAGLEPGTYEATITLDDPAAANNPQEILVSLAVFPEDEMRCGDIPLYTRNIASPAVLILLDQSSSMEWEVDRITIDELPKTPDIANVVQEIVDQDGWGSGDEHNMVFFLENASGTGIRTARATDGYGASAPLLHVEYNDGSGVQTVESRVNKSGDDGMMWASMINVTANNVVLGDRTMGGSPSAPVRFENVTVPQGATITNAYIEFVPALTESDPLTLTIYGQHHENPPTFALSETMGEQWMTYINRVRTTASVTWPIPAWTGITIEKRIDIAKSVISELVEDPGISWGFGTWCNVSPYTIADTQITHGTAPDTWTIAENPKKDDENTLINSYTIIQAGTKANSADHQAKLQSAIDLAETHTNTPFTPSLLAGYLYFEGKKRDDATLGDGKYEDGDLFESSSCQPKFIIEVTDGVGNVDPTIIGADTMDADTKETAFEAKARENTAKNAAAGINTIGIGFGLKPDEATQLFAVADESNAAGDASSDDYLYAIHQVVDGEAQPFFAETKEDLVNAFRMITNSVKGAVFYGSAPAATTSTDLGDVVIVASFDAANWNGDVSAIGKQTVYNEAKGIYEEVWNTVAWAADDNIPETRDIWTVNPSTSSVMAYTTDTLANDNYLCKDIGDIIHSTPVVVGSPPFFHKFSNYKSFVIDKVITNPRDSLIYVGSNDGMLHVFNLATGVEEWAFLPKSLQDTLNHATENSTYDMCSTDYCHQYTLDGSPMVADVYVDVDDQMQWRTMLVIGQREGGGTYTALDVTSGQSPDPSNSDPARYLWEYSDASLGETWSDPSIVRVRDATGDVDTDVAWGMYFGSGYATDEDDQVTQEARIYALDAYSGTPLWSNGSTAIDNIKLTSKTGTLRVINNAGGAFVVGELVTGANSGAYGTILSVTDVVDDTRDLFLENIEGNFQVGEDLAGNDGHNAQVGGLLQVSANSQTNDALASPLVVNLGEPAEDVASVGAKFERIYVGNLYGTMFRVENIGKGQTPAVAKLFEFTPYPSSPEKHPIRAKAAFAYGKRKTDGSGLHNLWIYYGTGNYETQADKVNREIQYFFGLKDEGAEHSMSDLTATTFDAEFLTASVDGVDQVFRYLEGSNANNASWAVKLYATDSGGSERVLTQATVVDEVVFFTTFIPDDDICTGSGDAYLFVVDYNSGLAPSHPVFDINADGIIDENDKIDDGNGNMITPVGMYIGRGTPSRPVVFKDTIFVTLSAPASTGNNGLFHTKWGPRKAPRVESWKQH